MAEFQALARGGDRRLPRAGGGAGAGRRLGAVHAGRARPLRVPRHRPRRCGPGSRTSSPRVGSGALHERLPESGPGGRRADPPRATGAGWCGRWRSSRSPVGRSARRCRSSGTSTRRTVQVGVRIPRPVARRADRAAGAPDVGRRPRRRGAPARRRRAARRAARRTGRSATSRCWRSSTASAPRRRRSRRPSPATRRFARRQDSWFRKDPRIAWVDWDDPDRAERAVAACRALPRHG